MKNNKKGVALLSVICFMGILTVLTLLLITETGTNLNMLTRNHSSAAAFWLAEAGMEKALYEIERSGYGYEGEETNLGGGMFRVSVKNTGEHGMSILSEGIFTEPKAVVRRMIEVSINIKKLPDGRYSIKEALWKTL